MEPVEGAQTFHTCSSTDYTAFMGRYSRARTPFAEHLGVTTGQRSLNLGCGAGSVAACDPPAPALRE